MRLSTLVAAIVVLASGGVACAQPIAVVSDAKPRPPISGCGPAAPGAGADIECLLTLTPPPRGAAPRSSRILIRAQWAAPPCASRDVQVVELAPATPRRTGLPIVDQGAPDRGCAS